MGQYLSAPITEKESSQGQNERVAYGLSAMQGWRVSMEDAHIADLALDDLQTALFSIFDGHGGKAVAKFCAKHLPGELLALDSYKRGDLATAITEAYFRLDELLDSDEGKVELKLLVGGGATSGGGKGLFSDVEGQLELESPANDAFGAAQDADSRPPPFPPHESPKQHRRDAAKLHSSSEQFRRSALLRHSVLPGSASTASATATDADPLFESSPADVNAAWPATAAAAESVAAAAPPTKGAGVDGSSEEEEDDESHKANGMGCTAVSALLRGDEVIVANAGDSRCVLSRRGEACPLTLDHKPILYEEAQRIIKAGGFVRDNRINGALNVSRTIGDLDFKRNTGLPHTEQMVVATPDVATLQLQEGDEFLILACDGIWDVLTNQEAVDFVRKKIKQGQSLQSICEEMCDRCLAPDLKGMCRGADNMSVVVVLFRSHANLDSMWSRMRAAFRRLT